MKFRKQTIQKNYRAKYIAKLQIKQKKVCSQKIQGVGAQKTISATK